MQVTINLCNSCGICRLCLTIIQAGWGDITVVQILKSSVYHHLHFDSVVCRTSVAVCTCTTVGNPMDSCCVLSQLIHWHTCNSLPNTLVRAVEQLVGCFAKQAKVSSQGQSTTVMQWEKCLVQCPL